jgi:Asp-tRNA(Asn)/Glu-tRNA(Gln) amidotransferase A subunit family amidase
MAALPRGILLLSRILLTWQGTDHSGMPSVFLYAVVSSTVVQRLIDAGAIPVGTNLDQFATGLNGTRLLMSVP